MKKNLEDVNKKKKITKRLSGWRINVKPWKKDGHEYVFILSGIKVLTSGASISPPAVPLCPAQSGHRHKIRSACSQLHKSRFFSCSRMKSEKYNGLARACSSVCPPVTRCIFYLLTKTLGNDACHASLSVTESTEKKLRPFTRRMWKQPSQTVHSEGQTFKWSNKGRSRFWREGDTERLFGTSWRLHQPQPGGNPPSISIQLSFLWLDFFFVCWFIFFYSSINASDYLLFYMSIYLHINLSQIYYDFNA